MQRTTVRRQIRAKEPSGSPAQPVTLIVTADEELREAAARVVAENGYKVLKAAHAGHAVLACLESGRVDVLAVDLSMPDMSGPALAAKLRRHCPDLASIYFANPGTSECEQVLVRPFTGNDLLAALATARATRHLAQPISAA